MAILLRNALLAVLDPVRIEFGDLRLDAGRIVARGKLSPQVGDEQLDCAGALVLAGLVNGHTHLYSALAVGMPAPPRSPRNFLEILQLVWWRLDQALDAESTQYSAAIGALDALHAGTTTLIDHHASPNFIDASLDAIERGIQTAGLRGVLCYETTDRHGRRGRDAGLAENRRYLHKCAQTTAGRFAGLAGAHASFTLDDESLAELAKIATEFQTGVHIHVAEDPCDEAACRKEHGAGLIDRLERFGLLDSKSIFAHGTHMDANSVARVNAAGVTLAHNPRSNMNNAVGYAPIGRLTCPIMLGTDGIGGDMISESRHAWFKSRDGNAGISPADILKMLAASARRASAALGITLGRLDIGAAADVVVTDYIPFSPLTPDNFPGHFFFGISTGQVRHVLVDGKWALRDRAAVHCDEPALRRRCVAVSQKMWRTMESISP